jgi:hypothetical protein
LQVSRLAGWQVNRLPVGRLAGYSFQLSHLQTSNSSKKTGGCKKCINHRIQKLGGNPRDLGQKLLPFSSLSATSDSAKKTPNPLQYVALKTEMVLL